MRYILLIGGDGSLKDALARAPGGADVQVDWARTFSVADSLSAKLQYDAALLDAPAFGTDEAAFVVRFAGQNPGTALIPVSPGARVELVIETMRSGAADFIHGIAAPAEILARIESCIEKRRMRKEIDFLRHTQPLIHRFNDIVGESPAMQRVFGIMRKVAPSDATVLITGETGTGKEVIAGAIHFNSSRAGNSFVKVNCAALPENLLESELFGHEKGAFTGAHRQRVGRFEQADGGTIFLDEIGDMGMSTQAKILRVLQEQQFERLGGTQTINVDVRVITATNKHLSDLMAAGTFREDLFYRLNVVTIDLAPLRQRGEDIEPLVKFFLRKFEHQLGTKISSVSPAVMKMLKEYRWPGNIRQLQNVIERAVIMCEDNKILPEHIALHDHTGSKSPGMPDMPEEGLKLMDVERTLIVQALERSGWVQKKAAKLLGISPRVINYKIKKHKIKGAGA
jgi:two-component system response regulator AtoC